MKLFRFKIKKRVKSIRKIKMTKEVFEQLKNSIGRMKCETGGILGMKRDIIDTFFFDYQSKCSYGTYSPNIENINAELDKWTDNDVVYMGAIHSHPRGITKPSMPDETYAERLLKHISSYDKAKPFFYMPIVQTEPDTGEFRMFSYIGFMERKKFKVKEIDLYIDGQLYNPYERKYHNFDRISCLYPLEIMAQKTLVCIGTGGARSYVENLARSGVTNFVLIDNDIVSEANIATQEVFYSEIKETKVNALKRRILDINPSANVIAKKRFLNDKMSDKDFEKLIGNKLFTAPKDILITGCTDNFYANARASRLALKYGTPYLQAGLYQGGLACEIAFSYPVVTPSCCRCATNGRYKAYETGFENDTTSQGTPIFATEIMNAMKGYVSLMLLLHKTNSRFGRYLEEYKSRNFIQINLDPYSTILEGKSFGEPTFFEQVPDNPENGYEICKDCQGTGNLEEQICKIKDTRKIFNDKASIWLSMLERIRQIKY